MLKITGEHKIKINILDNIIDLSTIDGWNDLSSEQKRYVAEYGECNLEKFQAAMNAGVPFSTVKSWFEKDFNFITYAKFIKDILSEKLMSRQILDAIKDPKYRAAVLKALDHEMWKEEKKTNTTNVLIADGEGIQGFLSKVKSNSALERT